MKKRRLRLDSSFLREPDIPKEKDIGLAEGGYEAYWNSRMKFGNSVCMVFAWAGPVLIIFLWAFNDWSFIAIPILGPFAWIAFLFVGVGASGLLDVFRKVPLRILTYEDECLEWADNVRERRRAEQRRHEREYIRKQAELRKQEEWWFALDGTQFEHAVAALYRSLGYSAMVQDRPRRGCCSLVGRFI